MFSLESFESEFILFVLKREGNVYSKYFFASLMLGKQIYFNPKDNFRFVNYIHV